MKEKKCFLQVVLNQPYCPLACHMIIRFHKEGIQKHTMVDPTSNKEILVS